MTPSDIVERGAQAMTLLFRDKDRL